MTAKTKNEVTVRPRWIVLIGLALALMAIETGPRVWLMARSEIIAQDGDYYLRMARGLRVAPDKAMRDYVVHPAYPAAVLAVHGFLAEQDQMDDPRLWERAGKCVAFSASIFAILGVWVFASGIFRNWWIGFGGALLFGLGRKFATLGADVLSDSLMLCFAFWSLVLALQTAQALWQGRKRTLLWAAGTGLLVGAAYWVRPEGIVVLLIAMPVWLAIQIRRRVSWPLAAGALTVAVVCAVLVIAPYGLSHKWRLEEFSTLVTGSVLACLGTLAPTSGGIRLLGRFFEAQHPALATLTCVYLLLWCLARTKRGKMLREILPRITTTGWGMILLAWLWIAPPLLLRYWSTGAMSHRYLMILAGMMAGLPVAAVLALARLAVARISSPRRAAHLRRIIVGCVMLGVGVGMTLHTRRPLHTSHVYSRNAGLWLASHLQSGDTFLTDLFYVRYYSDATPPKGKVIKDSAHLSILAKRVGQTPRQYIASLLDLDGGCRFVVLLRGKGPSLLNDAEPVLQERGYRRIKTFPYISKGKARPDKKAILLFEKPHGDCQ